jgi:16S rRNA processing protein RimM
VARLLRARGNRGEVIAEDLSDHPERFAAGARFFLAAAGGEERPLRLENAWRHKGRLILKFEGVDSISAAETLCGARVQIPAAELGPPPEGEHYYRDLIGCRVLEVGSGRDLGEIVDVLEPGGPPLLQVKAAEREILIPFVSEICVEIEEERKAVHVRLPEGLENLNP